MDRWPRSPVTLIGPKPLGLPDYLWHKCSKARYVSRALIMVVIANGVVVLCAACFPRMRDVFPWVCQPPQGLFSLFALVALSWLVALVARRQTRVKLRYIQSCGFRVCPDCGYRLVGLGDHGTCPECGRAYDVGGLVG